MITLFSAYKDSYDCNAVNESGDSPLHIVCRSKPTDYLVKLLVQTMKCRVDIQNKEGNLPLHIVCQGKQTSIGVIRLLTSKLDDDKLFLCNNCGKTALCEFLQSPHQRYGLRHFKSMLEIFIRRCQHDALREKFIPLACRYCKLKFVKFLCETYIPSPSARLSARSLLYHACLNHNKEVLDYILNKYEHNVNEPHTDGDLPVHLALQTKVCTKSTIFLIKSTANINQRNSLGNTPLHEVYRSDKTFGESHRQILMTFLQLQCVDISVQNLKGETPLHCMCRAERSDDLELVIAEMDINADIQDENGITVLHIICQQNDFTAAQLLFDSNNVSINPSIKDYQGQSPITLTTNTDIIKLLTKHGADPQPLYDMHRKFFEKFSCVSPPPTPVNLIVVGNACVGKTTLIQSLQNEYTEKTILDSFDHIAGVIPTKFKSKVYGEVMFYDFAGQPEYYASHDAVMHDTIKNLPPIVLILVNLTDSEQYCLDQIRYWINFLANRCTHLKDSAHMVIVGSHSDILEAKGMTPSDKVCKLHRLVVSHVKDKIILKDFLHINCTKSQSEEISKLQTVLKKSTSDLREKGVMHFNSHCFYVFLLQMFQGSKFVTIGRVESTLTFISKDNTRTGPYSVIPSDRAEIIELCRDLDRKGHIMFIEHPTTVGMCWLILDKTLLFNKLLGMLFAPISFPQHRPLSYSTGVVPLLHLENHFCAKENYPSSLVLNFLSRMEYCREVTDIHVLQSIVEKV